MLIQTRPFTHSRRDFLRAGLYALGVSTGLPALLQQLSFAQTAMALDGAAEKHPNRILVVVELSGGNDGLNTVVPFADDAYYRARPKLAVRQHQVLKLDDQFGLNPSCAGLERVFKDGQLAIVHGCGYPNPNLSHFTAMEWWHTAAPHGSDKYGWLGRFADTQWQPPIENCIVNIASRQSRAVIGGRNSPVVFSDPKQFGRMGTEAQQKVFETFGKVYPTTNASLDFVNHVSHTATAGAAVVRHACAEYRSLVDYGSDNNLTLDLKKVSAMIAAELPTRIYYLNMGGFDTHAAQAGLHQTLLVYLSDALRGFQEDLQRLGRADDVAVMLFTEFGRRVRENASQGTDHGTATPMFILGKNVRGGFYGTPPSLTDLDGGNLRMTTDFRSVYGTLLSGWMGFDQSTAVLKGDFPVLPVFRSA
jgi:uncharacterized protein (DUF1501 family)